MAPDPNSPIRHSGPILRLSRVNRLGLRKCMVGYITTKLRRAFAANLAQTGQRKFWQIATGNFVSKADFFAQTGHTRRRAELCAAALQADSLGTRCERQKRHRAG